MLNAHALPTISEKEIEQSVVKIKEICEAFLLPQVIVSDNLQSIYKELSDKSFWIALSDIHSITCGKLVDYGIRKDKDADYWEFEAKKE